MPKFQTELFGQIVYGAEISYDGLLALEDEMKLFITSAIDSVGGEFLSFESEGDRTFFQCAFQSCPEESREELVNLFAKKMSKQLESKLMFVDRMLCEHYFYGVNHKSVQERTITLPCAGPIDKSLGDDEA